MPDFTSGGDLVFALTDLEMCAIDLFATIVLCTIGLGISIYHHLRRTAFHISYQIWHSADFHPSDPMVGSLTGWPDCKPLLKHSTEDGQSSPKQAEKRGLRGIPPRPVFDGTPQSRSVGLRRSCPACVRASADPQTTPFVLAIRTELIVHCITLGRYRTCDIESECSRDCEIGEDAEARCRSGVAGKSRSEGPVAYKRVGDRRC